MKHLTEIPIEHKGREQPPMASILVKYRYEFLIFGTGIVLFSLLEFYNGWLNSESWGCVLYDNGTRLCEGFVLRFYLQNNLQWFIGSLLGIILGIILLVLAAVGFVNRRRKADNLASAPTLE